MYNQIKKKLFMARIKWTFFIKKLTGKAGEDKIAQTWRGVNYFRKRWPVNMKKRSAARNANCKSFGNITTRWRELSPESRETWKWYARKSIMSGYTPLSPKTGGGGSPASLLLRRLRKEHCRGRKSEGDHFYALTDDRETQIPLDYDVIKLYIMHI